MIGSFATHISSNKADSFIVVGIALTVWFFALYYGGGLTLDLVKDNRLSWYRVGTVAGALLVAALLLWQVTVLWLFMLLFVLLAAVALRWSWKRRGSKAFLNLLMASVLLALTVGFWYLGLAIILLVLTAWQTAALTLGLASLGVSSWFADRARRRWADLELGNRRAVAVARVTGFLTLGVILIVVLIATS